VIEIFANDGETVLTERVYPTAPLTRVEWVKGEAVRPGAACMWTLRSVWDTSSR